MTRPPDVVRLYHCPVCERIWMGQPFHHMNRFTGKRCAVVLADEIKYERKQP